MIYTYLSLMNSLLFALILLAIWVKLREARKARGWTIEDLAWKLGVDPTTVGRWERLVQKPSEEHIEQLSHLFSWDPSDVKKQISVVYGKSGSGKSALVRAAMLNAKKGEDFFSSDESPY